MRRRPPSLATDGVHVWRAFVPKPRDLTHLAPSWKNVLSSHERAQAARLLVAADRRRFEFGRCLLRHLLSGYSGIAADALRFSYGAHGKPQLAAQHSCRDIHFNLSHSGNWVVCAFGRRALGVDIESIRDDVDYDGVARLIFSERDRAAFAALTPPQRSIGVFQMWAYKEAYAKALGDGLAASFPHILDGALCAQTPRDRYQGYSLIPLSVAPTYAGALATAGNCTHVKYFDWYLPRIDTAGNKLYGVDRRDRRHARRFAIRKLSASRADVA